MTNTAYHLPSVNFEKQHPNGYGTGAETVIEQYCTVNGIEIE